MIGRRLAVSLILALAATSAASGQITTITFDDQNLAPNSYRNNAGTGGQFTVDGARFNNVYDPTYDVWSGWALTSATDTTTLDYSNQYSAITGSGADGSAAYAMAFTYAYPTDDPFHPADSWIDLPAGESPLSIDVTNATYTYLTLVNGYQQAHAFSDNDFLLLDVRGYSGPDGGGQLLGTVYFYLADFLNGNSSIVDTWQTLALTDLAGASSLRFGLTSSDNDSTYGINDPAFVAFDNLRLIAVCEPSTLTLLAMGLIAAGGMRTARTRRWRGG